MTYEWKVNHRSSEDARVFVHFLDQGGRIVFQQDHRPNLKTPEWRPGETVTDGPWDVEIPKGDARGLEVVAGLYSGRGRVRLAGVDLGQRRYGLGFWQCEAMRLRSRQQLRARLMCAKRRE